MSYLSQSAVEFDALPKKVQAGIDLSTYATQRKYDGVSGIVNTSDLTCVSRTGGDFASCHHIIRDCRDAFGPGWVVFGEIWHPTDPQSKISGDARRAAPAPHLEFVIFDAVPTLCFRGGGFDEDYSARYARVVSKVGYDMEMWPSLRVAASYNPGTIDPAKLKAQLGSGKGYDGIIRRSLFAPWIPGKDKHGYVIKDKPDVTFDLEVIGTEQGKGRNANRIGAYLCRFRGGKVVKVSGMTDAERDADPASIIGKIIEVEAMGESSQGSLREPRYKGIRYDKDKPDF